jgi:hypothetical protein
LLDQIRPSEYIRIFREKLTRQPDNPKFVREHILHGPCAAIEEGMQFDLKQRIAEKFSIEATTDVFIVGSAKLGFSIAPQKRYRAFGDSSDVDVAIVNHELYQRIWHELQGYKDSGADWPKRASFERFLAWGWIRPDKLPQSASFSFSNEWWEFFRAMQKARAAGPYKVAGAIYHDISFLVRYQVTSVAACRLQEEED